MQYLYHPDEFLAMLKLRYAKANAPDLPNSLELSEDSRWCYDMLNKTSRSFAFVIQELGAELRDVICIFYLVLRGLDTVEDDMSVPLEKKLPVLLQFHEKLHQPGWNASGFGEKDERVLVEHFDKVISVFNTFKPKYQAVIKDITQRMGAGMAEFCQRPVVTHKDYDLYCHYVAGLVGIGLSQLFAASGAEDQWFATAESQSNQMGLFLQKTNITRDYLEDIQQKPPRIFWPRDVWGKYSEKLENFQKVECAKRAVECLNDLVTDALSHAPASLDYLSRLRDQRIFNFCAIPQVMAIATLALCYNNHNVFTGVVKIRRGQTAKLMNDIYSRGQAAVYEQFLAFANEIEAKINPEDPNAAKTKALVAQIKTACGPHVRGSASSFGVGDVVAMAALAASSAYLVTKHNKRIFAKL